MLWKSWLKLIGIFLLLWIVSTVDWGQAIQALLKLDRAYLVGYLACFVAMMFVRTIRLRLALAKLDYQLTFNECYVATLEPAFMGVVTPARLGEFSRVGYIHAHGVALQEAFSVVTVERLIDVAVLLVFGAGGMAYIFFPAPLQFCSVLIVAFGLLFLFGALRSYDFTVQWLREYLGWILRWEPSFVAHHRHEFANPFHHVMNCSAIPIFLLGLVSVSLNFIQIFFLAKAFGFDVDYLVVVFSYAVATLVALLPISVGGLGTREATYIMIMAREGIEKEQALLFSLIDGVVLSILGLVLLLIPIWILRISKK